MIEGGSNNKGSKERLETPPYYIHDFRRFVIMKNYLNTYKTYITSCNLWRVLDRAIETLVEIKFFILRFDSILITPRLFYRVGYLLYVFIINGILFFNQDRLYYQALYSLSYCLVPLINPSSKNFYKLNPRSNFANRFNKLNYKTINNKCK